MKNGETVFVMMTSGQLRDAQAFVWKATVVDAENNIVRDEQGRVRVLEDFEHVFDTEARAWDEAAGELLVLSSRVRDKAHDCLQRAAACRIVTVPA